MPRIKSQPRSIFTYKEKRYAMNPIFNEEATSPLSPLGSEHSSDKDLPIITMKRKTSLFTNECTIFDICGLYEDLIAIRKILTNFPCMNSPNMKSDMYKLESNVNDEDTNQGRCIITTPYTSLSEAVFIIKELLEFHDFSEEFTLELPVTNTDGRKRIRMFWAQ